MNRINVTFYDETYTQLEERMQRKKIKSIAHCIRELVDLGLKVEEVSRKNQEQKHENDPAELMLFIKKMMKVSLTWGLETRLLARHLIENADENSPDESTMVLKNLREAAENHIEKLLKEDTE